MAIPDFQTLMLPFLKAIVDGRPHRTAEVTARLADQFQLSSEERTELIPSGRQAVFTNRVAWANVYLKKAGLVDAPVRGVVELSEAGRDLLASNPASINTKDLTRYPSFAAFRQGTTSRKRTSVEARPWTLAESPGETPDEALERLAQQLREQVALDLLEAIRKASPGFFERLVVQLLVTMGYGGSYADAASVIGRSGDEGIDGVIKEDRLGLDAVYVQAKRWQASVGRPDIQRFAGSLEGARAHKGVFITTSGFSPDARAYVDRIEKRIVLVDGRMLTGLMIDHGVGVSTDRTYAVTKVDHDFFEES